MNKKYKRLLADFLVGTGVLLLIIGFSLSGAIEYFDGKLYDVMFHQYRREPVHRDNVVIVCIDQKSIDFFAENMDIGWPWPRAFHGRLVDYLTQGDPKSIVFDVIFSEQDVRGAESDDELAYSINESGLVDLSAVALDISMTSSIDKSVISVGNSREFDKFTDIKSYVSLSLPIDKFSDTAKGIGLVNFEPDDDSITRRYPLVSKIGNDFMPSLAYTVVKGVLSGDDFDRRIGELLNRKTVVGNDGTFLVNWYGKGGTGRGVDGDDGVFTYYSYHAVLASAIQMERGETPLISSGVFQDKIVVIGSNAAGLFGLESTPFTGETPYPGMEIHATAIENMLDGDYFTRITVWQVFLIMSLLAVLTYLINAFFQKIRYVIISNLVIIAGEIALSFILFSAANIWIYPAELLLTTSSVFFGLIISGYIMASQEKKFIHNAFGKYLAPQVVDQLVENPEMLNQIAGETRNITIYFSDIAKFTTISEYLGPERLVKMLNEYFEEMTDIIQNLQGTVDRFEGDAIMAFYGAPLHFENHAELACMSCLDMQEKLESLRESWKNEDVPEVHARMGVNTGVVMVGNMGSISRKQYSVVGDPVNLAARLESLNKQYGTYMMIGENTYEEAKNAIEVRELDIVRVVGKVKPVTVYELLSRKGGMSSTQIKVNELYSQGLALYKERQWDKAVECFQETLRVQPVDGPSQIYIDRCGEYKLSPPPEDWDFSFSLTKK